MLKILDKSHLDLVGLRVVKPTGILGLGSTQAWTPGFSNTQNPKRACIFIDGSNFYFKLKELAAPLGKRSGLMNLEYRKFAQWLVGADEVVAIRYYIGMIKNQSHSSHGGKLYAAQQIFFEKLQQQSVSIITGHIIRHPDKSFHEKGVDVRIAVEMIRLAREDKYDVAYLLSSDTDLVPAAEEVQSFNKKVIYVCTEKGRSYGLSSVADGIVILKPEDISNFL